MKIKYFRTFCLLSETKGIIIEMNHLNRWIYASVGVVIMLLAGLVYAWTVLQAPIAMMYKEWTKSQLSVTFTIIMFCFCLGGFLGGVMQKKTDTASHCLDFGPAVSGWFQYYLSCRFTDYPLFGFWGIGGLGFRTSV
ncbi:hypothetical protein Q5O14_08300 [Eubacteriaceae bacterium ES2]|uniref:hypothetical protein n=1 Tax=unclassified Acetobacterium TaxID=2638182 RepID=UPI001FA851AA|nr:MULTISPECIES: hypothetical protein [unclassified Acetobacterium]WKY46083.1 hypothetical protein Q5O14_08300 [Eubacteriaceae bacterium ES2]